jgi:uncharacterized protein YndB with AHSA1/START domain
MARFHFTTEWSFDAPIGQVWDLVSIGEDFPRWWPGFERAQREGDDVRYRLRGVFGMKLEFVQHTLARFAPSQLRIRADGDLVGTGVLRLFPTGRGTRVSFVWDVELGRPWLRRLSRLPGMKRLMQLSHDHVMEKGRRSLERLLA